MPESMIERVARAIYDRWREIEGAQTTFDEMVTLAGKDGYANAKRFFRLAHEEARAAVQALREPSEAMLDAASRSGSYHTWQAMLDAILTEGQPVSPATAAP